MFHTVLMYQVTREFYPCRGTSVPHSVDVPGDARVLSVQGYEFDVTRVEVEASVFPAGVRGTRLSQAPAPQTLAVPHADRLRTSG